MADRVDRLGIEPIQRTILLGGLAAAYGLFHGITRGAKLASLRYLAENAHRLPRTKGTWYFFHKRKNNVVLKEGINAGVLTALKYGIVTSAFFGVEAFIDESMSKVSWMSTAGSSFVIGSSVALFKGLSWQQCLRSVRNFTLFGATVGILQDLIRSKSQLSRELRIQAMNEEAQSAEK